MNAQFELTDEQKEQAIQAIQQFFYEQRDEDIGELAALLVLDFISEHFGPYFYNLGLADAKGYMEDKLQDLYSLEK